MLDYSHEDIQNMVRDLYKKEVDVEPIGNHELARHLVYKVKENKDAHKVFKLYFKGNRRNREMAALGLLKKSHVNAPKVVDFGTLCDGTEWLMMDFIKGITLDKVIGQLDDQGIQLIMKEMGEQLGKIHNFKRFDFFGNWDEKGRSLEANPQFDVVFPKRAEITFHDLLGQRLPHEDLFRKAISKVRKHYDLTSNVKEACLCHNDFDGRNVLVNKQQDVWHVVGVIDFEQSLPWDRNWDLVSLYQKYFIEHPEYKRVFFEGYRRFSTINEDLDAKMKFYLLFMGLTICSWSYRQAPSYYREGVKLLNLFIDEI